MEKGKKKYKGNNTKSISKKSNNNMNKNKTKRVRALLAAGIVTISGIKFNMSSKESTIVRAQDLPTDEYNLTIPLMKGNGNLIGYLENDSIIEVDGLSGNPEGRIKISTIQNGEIVKGYTYEKYLNEFFTIKSKELDEYNIMYKVNSEDGNASCRRRAKIKDNNIKANIENDEFVLASKKVISKNDGNLWVKVLYVNDEGITKGYMQYDELQLVGNISNMNKEQKIDRNNIMIVDTSKEGGIDLKLRNKNNIDKVIDNIPNNAVVIVDGTKEPQIDKNGIERIHINYKDENGIIKSGLVLLLRLKVNRLV